MGGAGTCQAGQRPSKCPAPPSSRTLPHPLQSRDKQKWLPPDAPVTWSPVFYLTLQRGLFPGCAPSLFWVAAWEVRGKSLTLPSSHRSPPPPALPVTECREPPSQGAGSIHPALPGPGPLAAFASGQAPRLSGSHRTGRKRRGLGGPQPLVPWPCAQPNGSGEATWGTLGPGLLPKGPVLEQTHLPGV